MTDMKTQTQTPEQTRRLIWATTRAHLETDKFKHRKYGETRKRRWSLFSFLIRLFYRLLKLTPFYRVGLKNAQRIVLNTVDLYFPDLPRAFHGYRILHMTDLHLNLIPGLAEAVCAQIKGRTFDLCVLTGDYRDRTSGGVKDILGPLGKIVNTVKSKDGILATLGNHDSYLMTGYFEQMGITMLINQTVPINRDGDRIQVTGLDDPYYYYTDQCVVALEESAPGFKIALVHAPSMYNVAADNGYGLYLCGHTHGGQICLPGGKPIILHLHYGRKYYRGLWQYGRMKGYTGQGTGTVGIPIRFNTQSEITELRLYRRSKTMSRSASGRQSRREYSIITGGKIFFPCRSKNLVDSPARQA